MKPYYADEYVTLYHGDCREIVPQLDAQPDLVLADPPYGIKSVANNGKMGNHGATAPKIYTPVHGDDELLDVRWLLTIGERQIIWGAEHIAHWMPRGRYLVWDKRVDLPSNNHGDAEVAWDSKRGGNKIFRHRQMGMVHDGYGEIGRCHPNQKPERLMRWCLGLVPDARLVLDPFTGSGTTLRAAKDMGLRAIGIEIEERYCEIAARRLSQDVLDFGAAS